MSDNRDNIGVIGKGVPKNGVPKNGAPKNGAPKNGGTKLYAQWSPRSSAINAPYDTGARRIVTMGWHPDIPDFRDVDLDNSDPNPELNGAQQCADVKHADLLCVRDLPAAGSVDLRSYCSPVEDQGRLGSCTAQSVVGLMEYLMRRSGMDHIDGSRLFVYKVTRNLLGSTGDTGADLRTTMHAVRAFGVPPEELWPYVVTDFDEEPTPFLYSYAQNFKAIRYVRLDKADKKAGEKAGKVDLPADKILENVKSVLARGYPVVFGFTVYSSLTGASDIPFPGKTDRRSGGHAVMAVGYDDHHKVSDGGDGCTVPSLIIRNSWGPEWGEQGYGYLPYEYVLDGQARDFWTAYSWQWINTGQFDSV